MDRANEKFDVVFPKLNQVEKKVKLFFETEAVGFKGVYVKHACMLKFGKIGS